MSQAQRYGYQAEAQKFHSQFQPGLKENPGFPGLSPLRLVARDFDCFEQTVHVRIDLDLN